MIRPGCPGSCYCSQGFYKVLEQVFKLERQVIKFNTGATHSEAIYGITSMTPAEACPRCLLN